MDVKQFALYNIIILVCAKKVSTILLNCGTGQRDKCGKCRMATTKLKKAILETSKSNNAVVTSRCRFRRVLYQVLYIASQMNLISETFFQEPRLQLINYAKDKLLVCSRLKRNVHVF